MSAPAAEPSTWSARKARQTARLLDELQQAMDVNNGGLAEQRHWLDADADTCLPLPGVPHPRSRVDRAVDLWCRMFGPSQDGGAS